MNVVDSSCWLEYFAGSAVGDAVAGAIEDLPSLIIPSITLYEVFKKLLSETTEDQALLAVAHMKQGRVIELDADLAIYSAKIGKDNKLAKASKGQKGRPRTIMGSMVEADAGTAADCGSFLGVLEQPVKLFMQRSATKLSATAR